MTDTDIMQLYLFSMIAGHITGIIFIVIFYLPRWKR